MIARIDDRAPPAVRTDLEVTRTVVRVESNRPWVLDSALEQKPIAGDELLLGRPCERAPRGLLAQAVCGVLTRRADIVSLRAWHGAHVVGNERAHQSAQNDDHKRENSPSKSPWLHG